MNIPMPLRVPELAPSLGRVIVARRREPPWVPLDDIREELATAVLEIGGEGRGAAAREDRAQVLEVTGRRAWAAAWDQAVRRAAARVADALEAEIVRTARQVRLPRRRATITRPSDGASSGTRSGIGMFMAPPPHGSVRRDQYDARRPW